jgi:hypothetical protein
MRVTLKAKPEKERNFTKAMTKIFASLWGKKKLRKILRAYLSFNILKPTGYLIRQVNIQQLYPLPTLYLCVLYLS